MEIDIGAIRGRVRSSTHQSSSTLDQLQTRPTSAVGLKGLLKNLIDSTTLCLPRQIEKEAFFCVL